MPRPRFPARPGTLVIAPGWAEYHRPTAAAAMPTTCMVHRMGAGASGTFNETTGQTEYPAPTLLYSGQALVQAVPRSTHLADAGDRDVTSDGYRVGIAYTPGGTEPAIGDRVTLADSTDQPDLGGELWVADVHMGSLLWSRVLVCTRESPQVR